MIRLLALTLLAAPAAAAAAETLSVTVENVRSAKGTLFVSVIDKSDARVERQIVPATPGEMRVTFTDLAPGDYAVKIFHDANGNGRFDKNFLGLPSEGYGFSNDAVARFGPPSFNAMRVAVAADLVASTHARMTY